MAEVLAEAEQLRQAQPGRRLLLVVDQLEEVFTQVDAPAERQAFIGALWELAQASGLGITVVSTLRVDYFGRCAEIPVAPGAAHLDEVVTREVHRVYVPQLGERQLQAAIESPASAVGLELDEGLPALLARDVGQEPGALPLLEYALDLLWERHEGPRLTLGAYEAMAGVTGALTQTKPECPLRTMGPPTGAVRTASSTVDAQRCWRRTEQAHGGSLGERPSLAEGLELPSPLRQARSSGPALTHS